MSRPAHPVRRIVRDRHQPGVEGIYSVCSASEMVLEAACRRAAELGSYALIESTANQVNQFGGYTGMRPADFAARAYEIADRAGLDRDRLILGGDHLGPLVWQGESEERAMAKAASLVKEYVAAGFTKIHIDTSMRLGTDDRRLPLTDRTIARRAAALAAEVARVRLEDRSYAFIVGSEVPVPGGAQQEEAIAVTREESFSQMVDTFQTEFRQARLEEVWEEVIGVVVQPGVEFGDSSIHYYDRAAAAPLCAALKSYPTIAFEGHSTDYQPPTLLKQMVEDGIRILKVGPALTFYQREALFALEMVERELIAGSHTQLCRFRATLDEAMTASPAYWQSYYHGDERTVAMKRAFSFSDRCRYYLPDPKVAASIARLIANLEKTRIPLSVLSQYLPRQADLLSAGALQPHPRNLILSRITDCLDGYLYATGVLQE